MKEEQEKNSLHEELRKKILNYIMRMDFSFSTRLPSENQLAAKFLVSRGTIRSVLSELETEGKLLRKQGSGTYVNIRGFMLETTLYPRIEMRSIIRKNGYVPSSENLFIRQIRAGTWAALLGCSPDDVIQEAHGLYFADDRPCMYCIDRMRKELISEEIWKSNKVQGQSLYKAIKEFTDTEICWDIMRIRSVNCDSVPEISRYLVENDGNRSLVLLEIVNYDQNSRPVLYGTIYVNADIIQLNLIRDLTKL